MPDEKEKFRTRRLLSGRIVIFAAMVLLMGGIVNNGKSQAFGQVCIEDSSGVTGLPVCDGAKTLFESRNVSRCGVLGENLRRKVTFVTQDHSLSSGDIRAYCTTEACNSALRGKIISLSGGDVLLDGEPDEQVIPGCSCQYHQITEEHMLFDSGEYNCGEQSIEITFWGDVNSSTLNDIKYGVSVNQARGHSGARSARGFKRNLLGARRRSRSTVISGNTVYVEVTDGGTILIHADIPLPGSAHLKLGSWNSMVNIDNATSHVEIPLEFRLVSNTLYCDVVDVDGKMYSTTAPVVGSHTCYVKDCIVCWDSLTAWNCLPAGHKWLIGGLVAALILILLCFVPVIFKMMWWMIKMVLGMMYCCCNLRKSKGARMCSNKISRFVAKAEGWFKPEIVKETTVTSTAEDGTVKTTTEVSSRRMTWKEAMKRKRERYRPTSAAIMEEGIGDGDGFCIMASDSKRTSSGSVRNSFYFMLFMMIALIGVFIQGAHGLNCDTTVIGQSEISNCEVVGGVKSCTIEYDIELELTSIHDVACVVFNDNQGNMVHHLAVQLEDQVHRTDFEYLYMTYDWEGVYEAEHRCAESNKCSAVICLETNDANDMSAGNLLSGPGQMLPGETHCEPGCGCAGCGCLVCSDSCHFYRTAFEPVGNQFVVFGPSGRRVENHFSLTATHPDGSEDSTLPVLFADNEEAEITVGSDEVYVTPIGTFDSGNTIWGDVKVLYNTGTGEPHLGIASAANAPQQGIYGDIQSASIPADDANTVYSSDLVSVTVDRHLSSAHFADSPFTLGVELDDLPHVRGDVRWTDFEFDNMVGTPLTAAPVLVRVHTGSDGLDVSYETGIVCPEFSVVEVKGCCECDAGSEITISARSKCDPGAASVSISEGYSLRTRVITLTESFQTFSILFDSDDCHPSASIELFHGDKSEKKDFSGDLMRNVNVHAGNGSDVPSQPFTEGFGVRFSTGAMHWHEWLIFAGIGIGVVVVLVIAIWGCRKRWSNMMMKKQS